MFKFLTGKKSRVFDESLQVFSLMHQVKKPIDGFSSSLICLNLHVVTKRKISTVKVPNLIENTLLKKQKHVCLMRCHSQNNHFTAVMYHSRL